MATGIRARLTGKHVLLTGVTGFVGEALLQRLLSDAPETRITVLVRPRGSTSGEERIEALLKKPIFEGCDGGRVSVLEGDMADVPALPGDLDAVLHCAGDVSFNPPVDQAFTTNVVGTRGLLARAREVGDHVHYVHVSTAYVAGRRRGSIPEGPVEHDVDLEAELTWGLAQGQTVDERSRDAERLIGFRKEAERSHGRAGLLTAASAVEERRKEWVKEELVRLGTERARSLGWTDCYTFTKALGERVVEAHAAHAPVSIVRPSIIESALERPHPGWIEGFKMAEPLILAYGRGELPEFPAAADTIVDIVPVDHVVAALIAVLAHPPEAGRPEYFHVSSGARNPLTFRNLYDNVRGYFDAQPFASGDRGAARLPDWRFPGAQSVERLLSTSERAHKVANYVIGHAPRSDRARDLARKLDQQGRRLEFLRRYLDLYKEYAQAELRFSDDRTVALFGSLSTEDKQTFAFDTAVVDWRHYLQEVHCPAVTEPIRKLDELRREPEARIRRTQAADRRAGGRVLRHGRHPALVQRRRDLPVAAAAGDVGRRAHCPGRQDHRPTARPDPCRAHRPERVPPRHLPRVRRRPARRPRRDRRRGAHRPRAGPARAGRRTPGPRAPGCRSPDRADHRRDPAADPTAGAAVRRDRGRGARGRRPRHLHRLPGHLAAHR